MVWMTAAQAPHGGWIGIVVMGFFWAAVIAAVVWVVLRAVVWVVLRVMGRPGGGE